MQNPKGHSVTAIDHALRVLLLLSERQHRADIQVDPVVVHPASALVVK